mgnify:CR=1 FL=1
MSRAEKENDVVDEDLKVNSELIKRIKEIQDLPEEIILKFIQASGSLSSTDFEKDFINEQ